MKLLHILPLLIIGTGLLALDPTGKIDRGLLEALR